MIDSNEIRRIFNDDPKEHIQEQMSIEAELQFLEKELARLKKEERKLKSSKGWNLTKVIGRLLYLLATLSKPTAVKSTLEKQQMIDYLQAELDKVNKRLRESYLKQQELLLQLGKENEADIFKMIKESKNHGILLENIDGLIYKKSELNKKHYNMLYYIARAFSKDKEEYKSLVYNKILKGLNIDEIPEFIIRDSENENIVSLKQNSSLQAFMSARARKRQLTTQLPEWILENKRLAYSFVDSLNVRRPWHSGVFEIKDLPVKENVVLKPVNGAGSRGVYLVLATDKIVDVKRGVTLNSWDLLIENMKLDLNSGAVEENKWMFEEFIFEDNAEMNPARDLKFYCFYGKVALVLEIQRQPELRYCWWTRDGKRIDTGKYSEELFHGTGATENHLKLAESISLEIPAPFIRIDFLKSEQGLVFGEFTPKPGNYDEFNQDVDSMLGDLFLDAENRLFQDMLEGKNFNHYKNLI
ncbi:ATP-grasp fold amidoligase family protein [Sutcliffiella horikoshii]|uniref:ATP-grasp fold amidoligase family protein n=1 Tax=Sutcliffiella horikoshii TaxID=79883 RepID=UPI00384ACD92